MSTNMDICGVFGQRVPRNEEFSHCDPMSESFGRNLERYVEEGDNPFKIEIHTECWEESEYLYIGILLFKFNGENGVVCNGEISVSFDEILKDLVIEPGRDKSLTEILIKDFEIKNPEINVWLFNMIR